jgi:spermidine synthase
VKSKLFSIESPFPEAHSMLRMLEAPGSSPNTLWERLFAGTYDRPFIVDTGLTRCLHFDLDSVQSAMSLQDPYQLRLAYTRKMMAFLLFNETPQRILLLGLGGGSLAKFCYRHLPSTVFTAVEVNPDVIALRDEFGIPPDDHRFRVIRADAVAYVSCLGRRKDVILVDACDRSGVAPQLDTLDFYSSAWRRLTRRGVFVANLCSDPFKCGAHLTKIRRAFGDDNVVTLSVSPLGNVIVFAFKERLSKVHWERLDQEAIALQRRFGLDLPRYLKKIALDWRLRAWRQSREAAPDTGSRR